MYIILIWLRTYVSIKPQIAEKAISVDFSTQEDQYLILRFSFKFYSILLLTSKDVQFSGNQKHASSPLQHMTITFTVKFLFVNHQATYRNKDDL